MLEYFTYKKFKGHKDKHKSQESDDAKKDDVPVATAPAAPTAAETAQPPGQPLLDKDDEQYFSDLISEAETPPVVILPGRQEESPPPPPLPARSSGDGGAVSVEDVGGAKPGAAAEAGEGLKEVGKEEVHKETGAKETEDSKKVKKEKDGKLFSAVEKRASTLITSGFDLFRKDKDKKEGKGKDKEREDGPTETGEKEDEDKGKKKEKEKKEKEKEKKKKAKVDGEELDEGVLASVMERLNLSNINGKLIAKSPDFKASVQKFTQILKDINNGVPTAYNDLINFFDTSSDTFARTFEALPKTLQNFVMRTLPAKLTPEVLRTLAATSPALATELQSGSALGLKELIAKPGLIASLLKSVVTFLKTRFPLLMGGGMAVSFGVTIVMLILWYCYKRGKEVRLEEEAKAAAEAGEGQSSSSTSGSQPHPSSTDLPPPPQPVPQTSFDRDIGHSDTLHETGP